MTKTITLRLTDKEYKKIVTSAANEHRPISNFITYAVLESIENSLYADSIEMAQINSDESLLKKLKRGHREARAVKKGTK